MANPSIDELRNSGRYDLIAELSHDQIKEFVLKQLSKGGRIIRIYMFYQMVMILTGSFFLTRSVVLAFRGEYLPLLYSLGAAVFTFTFEVVLHELLHGLALKITGAPRVHYGGYLRKFIFYAEADRHVLNPKQFELVALTPLVAVKLVTLAGALLFLFHPLFYFFILVMSAHSLFCAGDIGLLSIFYANRDTEIYTFDVREEKKSYYYRRRSDQYDDSSDSKT